jgi:hypothetical protein
MDGADELYSVERRRRARHQLKQDSSAPIFFPLKGRQQVIEKEDFNLLNLDPLGKLLVGLVKSKLIANC